MPVPATFPDYIASTIACSLLGDSGLSPPPLGFVYLLGADGDYLKGADGAYLLGIAP